MKLKTKPKNQSTNPRPRKAVKDELNDRYRLFFKTNGSSILIAKDLTYIAAKAVIIETTRRINDLRGKLNGNFYVVR